MDNEPIIFTYDEESEASRSTGQYPVSMEAMPYGHRRNTKREGDIRRLCRTIMEAMPYSHRRNTKRVRGPYSGYSVQAWKQYLTVIESIPYEYTGNIVRA